MSLLQHPHEEIFHCLLDESAALLAAPEGEAIAIPDDELHREIIVPLLPAMLGDKEIRKHWHEQAATGFAARLAKHLDGGEPAPRWLPGDFEIHVTASYSAGADARALADTLLSEESLRDLTAALMNQLLDVLWPTLAPSAAPAEPQVAIEVPAAKVPAPEIAAPVMLPETKPESALPIASMPETLPEVVPQILPSAIFPSAAEPERAEEIQPVEIPPGPQTPSRALIRALCGKISASAFQRGLAANSAPRGASAAIIARRILQSTAQSRRGLQPRAAGRTKGGGWRVRGSSA